MNNLTIRLETENDYRAVEELTREAFWNVYKPGVDEHYFVNKMRKHPDFIHELAFVLEKTAKLHLHFEAKRNCLKASHMTMPAQTETFSECFVPSCGSSIAPSQ